MNGDAIFSGALSGFLLLIVAEVIKAVVRQMQKSVFSDEERRYIEDEIVHKLNNFEIKTDAKYVHKRRP